MALAHSLAASGQWLAAPLAGPALRVTRLRGADLAKLNVAWPEPGPDSGTDHLIPERLDHP